MDLVTLRAERMRSHRLTAPAVDLAEAAAHMTATQSQEFWAGRWALASRTKGEHTLSSVDAAFDRGELVRSWTQRGTLHIVAPRDLGWILSVTAERQTKQHAGVHRSLSITTDDLTVAERAVRAALNGGNRLTRAEFAQVLAGAGVDTAGMRGNHILSALALRMVVVFGPVVPRDGAPTRDQFLVAPDDWIAETVVPADPSAELLVRYLRGHAPARLEDFCWWAGVSKGIAQQALHGAGDRLVEIEEGLFTLGEPRPRRSAVPAVAALAPFEEYYLSYADRGVACAPEFAARIGPTMNGMVRPVLVSDGEVIGVWSHSVAIGKHHLAPAPELFAAVAASEVDAALARFSRFITG